jgi:hypothetical protein
MIKTQNTKNKFKKKCYNQCITNGYYQKY